MGNASAAAAPISTLDDDAWDDLLSFIEERRVIPIVDGLPPALRALHDVRLWRDLIQQAQKGQMALTPPPPSGERSTG